MVMQTLREHLVLFANFGNITFECFLKLLKKQGTFKKKKNLGEHPTKTFEDKHFHERCSNVFRNIIKGWITLNKYSINVTGREFVRNFKRSLPEILRTFQKIYILCI